MSLSKPLKTALLCYIGVEIAYTLWDKVLKPLLTTEESVDEVFFFSSKGSACFLPDHNWRKCKKSNCPKRNLRQITSQLENATKTINVSMYRLTCSALSKSLETAIKKGVKVRVICDHLTNKEEPRAVLALRSAGAFVRPKLYDASKGRDHLIMHHKFVIIDEKLLITGSLNWTQTAICGNWEDAVLLSEEKLVKKFQDEFDYLWEHCQPISDGHQSTNALPDISTDWRVEPFNEVFMFREDTVICRQDHMSKRRYDQQSPSHIPYCAFTALKTLCTLISGANVSIDACLHLLTLEDVANCFYEASSRGVKIRVISDGGMADLSGDQIKEFVKSGLEVHGILHQAKMHHKFIVLDRKLILFGSFNYSMQAICGNCENLVCTNQDKIVKKFADYFDELWEEFGPLDLSEIGRRTLN